ncbi:MAG: hypothetical protein ACLU8Y_02295 [Clostridia bacterium]|jgi:hypothetical protein
MDITIVYKTTTYVYINESLTLSDLVNEEEPENKNAKIGQAIANVY